MILKSVIIDDEQNARDILSFLLQRYCPTIELVGTAEGVKSATSLIRQTKPDLIFLDINMRDGSGFELLDAFEEFEFQVVFVTAYDEYALKAFNYNALDYLVKPVDQDALIRTIARIEDLKQHYVQNYTKPINPDSFDNVVVFHNYEYHKIILADIVYCQSDNNYTNFYVTGRDKPILSSKTLKHYEELLPDSAFIRIHQSYLINIASVIKFDSNNSIITLRGGFELPVSSRKKSLVLSRLTS